MIVGIGTDIIEIERIEKVVENNKNFLTKSFTEKELEFFQERNYRAEVITGNFAAKEAISKALGTGFRGFGLKDIEVVRNEIGKPIAYLYGKAKEIADLYGNYNLQISISHDKSTAIAYCIIEQF